MSIESHPIFNSTSLASSDSSRFILTSHNGSRCVMYQDSSIRWCHVSEREYKYMQIEPPFINVDNALLSDSGNFLCLFNDVEIRIIEIPWAYSNVSSIASAFQKYRYLNGENEKKIIQVVFHPLASEDSTVVLLREDDSICLLNWQDNTDEIVLNERNGIFGVGASITEVSSISFSEDGLTLYALSIAEGGDIFAFYPCLPSRLRMGKKELDFLLHKSLVQYDGLEAATASETKRNAIKQLQFTSKLHSSRINDEKNEEAFFNIPEERRYILSQGPFTISPFPERFYDCTCQQIIVLPIGEDLELVLMMLDDGTIAVLFKDLELTMNWESIGYNFNNSFVLVETIKLDRPGKLTVPNGQLGRFAALCGSKTYFIDTTKWSQKLVSYIGDADLRLMHEIVFKSELTDVSSSSPTNAVCVWSSVQSESLVFISNSSVLVKNIGAVSIQKEVSQGIDLKSTSTYQTHFSQPIDEIMALNQSFQRAISTPPTLLLDPQTRQESLENENNEVQLKALTEVSKELMQKVVKGQGLGLILHNRLIEQQYELTCQLKSTCDVIERQNTVSGIHERQITSQHKIQDRQKRLLDRLHKLQDNLVKVENSAKYQEMKINRKEMEWFKEIRNQVITFNEYVRSQKNLQKQLEYVAKELTRRNIDTEQDNSLGDWKELRKMLEEDTKILEDCNAQLTRASTEFQIDNST